MRGYRKIGMDSLDRRWGKLVRERDGKCLYCGGTNYLSDHHIFGRSRSVTRYVLENGCSLCPSCHVFSDEFSAHKTPEKFKRWVKKYLGVGLYKDLQRRSLDTSNTRAKAIKEFINQNLTK